MRVRLAVRTGICLGTLTLAACSQGGQRPADSAASDTISPSSASSWPADSAAIITALTSSQRAWNSADLDGHYAIFADSVAFVFVPSGNDPPIRSLANARGLAAGLFKGGKAPAQLSGEAILLKPVGRDAAVSVERFTMTLPNGRESSGLNTRLWQRTPAGWRVVTDHTS